MNKAIFGMLAIAALMACCLLPSGLDASGEITHDGSDVMKISSSEIFDITYTNEDEESTAKITFTAKVVNKSNTVQADAVTPSSGSLTSGVSKALTVKVPEKSGQYTLVVEYFLDEEKDSESKYTFKAVKPITLTVNLKAEDVTLNLDKFGVYFYIDGEKMEDSYKTISLSSSGTGSVSYDWIADPVGTHTFKVEPVGETTMISGLGVEHTFYSNDNDYAWLTALALIILILLLIWAYRVYRKPIKNFGKPKSRR